MVVVFCRVMFGLLCVTHFWIDGRRLRYYYCENEGSVEAGGLAGQMWWSFLVNEESS